MTCYRGGLTTQKMDYCLLPREFRHADRGQKVQSHCCPKHFTMEKKCIEEIKRIKVQNGLEWARVRLAFDVCKAFIPDDKSPSFLKIRYQMQEDGGDEEDFPEGLCWSHWIEMVEGGQNQSPSVSLAFFYSELPVTLEESPASFGSAAKFWRVTVQYCSSKGDKITGESCSCSGGVSNQVQPLKTAIF